MNRRKYKRQRERQKALVTEWNREGSDRSLSWARFGMSCISGDLAPHRGQQKHRLPKPK